MYGFCILTVIINLVVCMARKDFKYIALPNELVESVQILVSKRYKGYTSVPEFIKHSIRKELEKVEG